MKFKADRPLSPFLAWLDQPLWAWGLSFLWILAVSLIAFWWHLGSIGLVDETEPLFAEAARQMVVTGDWITPYFNEATRFDKPPLVYWLMAIAYQVVGVNAWSARFPSALAATVLVGMGFYVLRRFGFARPGDLENGSAPAQDVTASLWCSAFIGSALIALNPQTLVWARTGVSDMLFSGCIGTALLAFFMGYAQPQFPQRQARWYMAAYGLSALAVLAKGPVGIVLPGLIVLVFLFYTGNLKVVLREMRLLRGSLLFLAITIPWYVLVIWANGEAYINSFFGYHNVERFTRVVNNHGGPWFFYFLVVPIAFVPWSVYLPIAIARLRFWQLDRWRQQPRSQQLGLFALVWFTVIFGFFTIAVTKLPSYTLPLLPAAAILVSLFWSDQLTRERTGLGALVSHLAGLVLMVGLAIGLSISPTLLEDNSEMPGLSEALRQSGIHLWGVYFWVGAAIAGSMLLLRRQGRWLWTAHLLGFVAFIVLTVMPVAGLMDAERQLPLRELSATIVQVRQPEERVLMVGFAKPSVVFYTQRPVKFLNHPEETPDFIRSLKRTTPQPPSVLILGTKRKIQQTRLDPKQFQLIRQSGKYQLIRFEVW
jgi:4-amino-4-deoxy-L-arabinose transferase-like glycosyltransferase